MERRRDAGRKGGREGEEGEKDRGSEFNPQEHTQLFLYFNSTDPLSFHNRLTEKPTRSYDCGNLTFRPWPSGFAFAMCSGGKVPLFSYLGMKWVKSLSCK